MGPEHELSIVGEDLRALPIVDRVIKAYCGKIVNFVELPEFTFGKEMQLHVMEIKANEPFKSPIQFEETMHKGVVTLCGFLKKNFEARLLGTGMHPLMHLHETGVWPHRHKKIYDAYGRVFNLKQHGWLNIQSFHLNLPYQKESEATIQHNILANICAYLPAVAASTPYYEGILGENVDNRLYFYRLNQREVPSVSGEIIPEYASSLKDYFENVICRYSNDLKKAGAPTSLWLKEWVNSRGVIFRFDRHALEVRIMDEQECIKSDVALSCYVRSVLRGLLAKRPELQPHAVLVADFSSVLKNGLNATVQNPQGPTARHVCQFLYNVAWTNATTEEKRYLPLIQKKIREGSLSDLIKRDVSKRVQRTSIKEAIVTVYSRLIRCLAANEPYS